MRHNPKTVFLDDEVATQIRNLIRQAQKYVLLVSPYLDLWGHLQDEIVLALNRKVKVSVIVRDEPRIVSGEDVSWLRDTGVSLHAVEGLHAKIYLNESNILVSSMNLTESSTKNSLEIGLFVQNEEEAQNIRDYVSKHLLPLSRQISFPQRSVPHPQQASLDGHCIRCERSIALDPSRPFCAYCYGVWAKWGNEEYLEEYCHMCGRSAEVSFAKPLCWQCYQQYR